MNSIEILAKEVRHIIVYNQSEFETMDSLVEHCKEIYKKEIDQAYQDGKDFAIINHLATESTSTAHNKEVHRQQIIAAYIAAKMERNKVKKHFAYFLKLERVQIAAQEYFNDTYGDGIPKT
jgi:predicted ribonuclease YlaK